MKKLVLSLVGAAALLSSPALAADLRMATKAPPPVVVVSPWDIAFGASIATDYNFRGITQSSHGPSVAAYFEPRFNITSNLQLYAGIGALSVRFPAPLTQPAAEIDLYAGIRPTIGPLAFDFGFIYYYYPSEIVVAPAVDTDFWEIYGKVGWAVNDIVNIGGNIYYSPSLLGTGAPATYGSATAKLTAPSTFLANDIGAYVSGELGRYWIGSATAFGPAFDLPDYTYWNLGFGFTWKVFTLDLRYHDTDLGSVNCAGLTGDPTAIPGGVPTAFNAAGTQSNWCGQAFIAKLSADLTLGSLK